jgi:predicted small secreted protein
MMKRFAYVAIATAVLAFGVGACKKAHNAGNDSMNAPHGGISAISLSR